LISTPSDQPLRMWIRTKISGLFCVLAFRSGFMRTKYEYDSVYLFLFWGWYLAAQER
jgi:hypothetical protein